MFSFILIKHNAIQEWNEGWENPRFEREFKIRPKPPAPEEIEDLEFQLLDIDYTRLTANTGKSEQVRWVIVELTVQFSASQIPALAGIYNRSVRSYSKW